MTDSKFVSWTEDKPHSLVSGGLLYELMKKLNVIKGEDTGYFKRVIIFITISWIPLLIISLFEGTFNGSNIEITLLKDFLVHTRLLIVVPFLILIEKLIDPAYDLYINATRRIISVKDEKKFEIINSRADKLSDSVLPEFIILLIIYATSLLSIEKNELDVSSWIYIKNHGLSFAGWYYVLIGFPIFQLLMARWLWRWIIWIYTAIRFSTLDLRIEATHADQAAGLRYLNLVPLTFGVLYLSVSTTFSANIAMNVIYFGDKLNEYPYSILGFVIVVSLILFSPLLSFIPSLIKARIMGIKYFGSLIQYHNNLYKEKWMGKDLPESESILGSLDNSSMADINGTYEQSINSMRIIPINLRDIIAVMILLLFPFLPLLFLLYSPAELVTRLISIIFG